MLGWLGRARKKSEKFAENRKEVSKETKQQSLEKVKKKKTNSVSIRFPVLVFPFFKLDKECARRTGMRPLVDQIS